MTLWPVDVEYLVHRTVYVEAETEQQARKVALDSTRWVTGEQPEPRMDTLRLATP